MGMFIEISIKDRSFLGTPEARRLIKTCPVDIFVSANEAVVIDADQEDECILCNRCLDISRNRIRIVKIYE